MFWLGPGTVGPAPSTCVAAAAFAVSKGDSCGPRLPAMVLPPTVVPPMVVPLTLEAGSGAALDATGLVESRAPLPDVMPAGNIGLSPAGLGADWAARVAADGCGLGTVVTPRRVCACTAVTAATAHK